jgi:ferredoxin
MQRDKPRFGPSLMSGHLRVDPLLCDAYGYCAELLPEVITLDEWGYPVIDPDPLPEAMLADARRAASACPRLALRLEAAAAVTPLGRTTPDRVGPKTRTRDTRTRSPRRP